MATASSQIGELPRPHIEADTRIVLPAIMLTLTLVTGFVDATSFLAFGRVFVANMTGNIVFLGFATAGAPGLSAPASLLALVAFLLGGYLTGRFLLRSREAPLRTLRNFAGFQFALFVVATALSSGVGPIAGSAEIAVLIVLLGLAMGMQNAGARHLAVADLTTTVLTLTVTGLVADPSTGRMSGTSAIRRLLSIGAMLSGAFGGAWLVLHLGILAPLSVATLLVGIAGVAAHLSLSGTARAAAPT